MDIIQNELKIDTDGLRFHAVHRVGKRQTHNSTAPSRPRPIIARFVVREDKDAVLAAKTDSEIPRNTRMRILLKTTQKQSKKNEKFLSKLCSPRENSDKMQR